MGRTLSDIGSFSTPTGAIAPQSTNSPSASADDASKKIRKPYTITKSRESWTEPEHDKFLEALQLVRSCSAIGCHFSVYAIKCRITEVLTVIGRKLKLSLVPRLLSSHAQKYFLKVQKSGTNEHLPPPRPKRKAAHPYPQKAAKTAPVLSNVTASFRTDPSVAVKNAHETGSLSCTVKDHMVSEGQPMAINDCSSNESAPKTRSTNEIHEQRSHGLPSRVLPDFAQVYGFIGSVFDPNTSGHLQRLKKLEPIDVETVLLLMRNLSINLTSPDFEDHRKLLSAYEIDSDKENSDDAVDGLLNCQPEQVCHLG